jgi:uncharacterized protein YeaO (DUF488 family)
VRIRTERVYALKGQETAPGTYTILVDRLWPRGLSKADLPFDEWAKELAPSDALRRWFGHDPNKWKAFERRYRDELLGNTEALDRLRHIARKKTLVLLYSARDRQHNQAEVLAAVLESRR